MRHSAVLFSFKFDYDPICHFPFETLRAPYHFPVLSYGPRRFLPEPFFQHRGFSCKPSNDTSMSVITLPARYAVLLFTMLPFIARPTISSCPYLRLCDLYRRTCVRVSNPQPYRPVSVRQGSASHSSRILQHCPGTGQEYQHALRTLRMWCIKLG